MAKDGLQPFCNIYSAFAQRAYDNIIHDLALLRLPVVLCFDRAGLVGEDGPTHHGIFDMAALRPIPHLTIASPMDEHELRRLMYTAQLPDKGTFVIRYPRGHGVLPDWHCPLTEINVGTGRCLRQGERVAIVSIGPIGNNATKAIAQSGLNVGHYDLRFLKPLDDALLHDICQHYDHLITLEDGAVQGGMGSAVLEWMNDHGYTQPVTRMGIPDEFIEHGTVDELQHICHIDVDSIVDAINQAYK